MPAMTKDDFIATFDFASFVAHSLAAFGVLAIQSRVHHTRATCIHAKEHDSL
jgi:hypothetical protein